MLYNREICIMKLLLSYLEREIDVCCNEVSQNRFLPCHCSSVSNTNETIVDLNSVNIRVTYFNVSFTSTSVASRI
jgi:hypothetical protein